MPNVLIDKDKLDVLANAISAKSGEALTLTLDEMVDAVDGISTGGGVTPTLETVTKTYTASEQGAVTDTITPSNGYDGIGEVDVTVNAIPFGTGQVYVNTEYYNDNGRKWQTNSYYQMTQDGWVNGTSDNVLNRYNAIASGTSVTPTESAQTIGGLNVMMEGAVTVNAIPSNYVGSGVTRRDSTDLTVSGATVSVPSGHYENGASKAVASGTEGTPSATKGAVSNHSVSVTPSVTNTAGYINGGTKTGTAVTVSASELVSGSQTITQNGTVDVTNLAEVVVAVQGGGGGMSVATASKTLSTAASSIQFTSLSGQPTSFVVTSSADQNTGGTKAIAVAYDGTSIHGMDLTTQATADTGFTQSYSNGTLTITATSAQFQANEYKLVYTYGGSSANLGTDDVQVGSGATSISFTGLSDEPDYFSCIFTSNFSTSSGYQRVISVVYDGNSTYGLAMDSGAKAISAWSYTYNNGTLTITSSGTNNGGYFHQPGDYHLTYGYGGTVEPTEIEVEPLSVTTNGTYTAPTGKAYSPVTVNVSGGGSFSVATTTWNNSTNTTTSHQFTGLSGTPKFAVLRCTSQLTRSSNQTYYYIADIIWDGTDAYGNYHLRSNGSYNNVASNANPKFTVTTGTNSITFTSGGTRGGAPGSFYNGTYELTYIY